MAPFTASKSKYRNKKCSYLGLSFDSQGERDRYIFLKDKQNQGIISELKNQVRFDLCVNKQKICSYVADFTYIKDGALVVEDYKSTATAKLSTFVLKKKLMKACHGIEIKLVKKPTDML
jgi:hypothetical protein